MTNRPPPMQDAGLIEAMNRASTLELYQLAAVLERLMTDPRRIVDIRRRLHLGQSVRFYDTKRDSMRTGRVADLRDVHLTVQCDDDRAFWKLPYAAVEPPPGTAPAAEPAAPQPAAPVRPTRADFLRGERVSFTDRHLQVHIGTIQRCNPKTATVEVDGEAWSVPYGRLRHVLDIG